MPVLIHQTNGEGHFFAGAEFFPGFVPPATQEPELPTKKRVGLLVCVFWGLAFAKHPARSFSSIKVALLECGQRGRESFSGKE